MIFHFGAGEGGAFKIIFLNRVNLGNFVLRASQQQLTNQTWILFNGFYSMLLAGTSYNYFSTG